MPPKKRQNQERRKNNEFEKWEHFKRGYCKWQNDCEKKHNDKVCNKIFFSHDTSALDDKKLKTLQRSQVRNPNYRNAKQFEETGFRNQTLERKM